MANAGKPKKHCNFLAKFRNSDTREFNDLTACQFLEIWKHYDADNSGYIDGNEIDEFLREFISSVVPNANGSSQVVSDAMLSEMKKDFMEAFDTDQDEKISITELAQIVPMEANFLLLFQRDNPLESSVDFMKVWKKYDKDCSGFIEADELKSFLSDLIAKSKANSEITDEKLIEYTDTILQLFDWNHDGKLSFSELSRLLPVKENFLCRPIFKNSGRLTAKDVDCVFDNYDRDRDNLMNDTELDGFLKDLLSLIQEEYDIKDFQTFCSIILTQWDVNHERKINRKELKMILLQQGMAAARAEAQE